MDVLDEIEEEGIEAVAIVLIAFLLLFVFLGVRVYRSLAAIGADIHPDDIYSRMLEDFHDMAESVGKRSPLLKQMLVGIVDPLAMVGWHLVAKLPNQTPMGSPHPGPAYGTAVDVTGGSLPADPLPGDPLPADGYDQPNPSGGSEGDKR